MFHALYDNPALNTLNKRCLVDGAYSPRLTLGRVKEGEEAAVVCLLGKRWPGLACSITFTSEGFIGFMTCE